MKNSARAVRRVQPKNALAMSSRRKVKHSQIYGDLPETASQCTAIVVRAPKLRITPVMQVQILRLYMEGCSLCEISRRTHRARQTVTKVVRAPDVQAKIKALREQLVGESDDWVESLNYRVRTEREGEMAYRLLKDFAIIPSPEKKAKKPQPQAPYVWHNNDPETNLRARIIGEEALRRGHPMSMEREELEKLALRPTESGPSLSLAPKMGKTSINGLKGDLP